MRVHYLSTHTVLSVVQVLVDGLWPCSIVFATWMCIPFILILNDSKF